ncbi:hypothetical protein K490DRAFT_49756 [Saccharata proteae CBS 121410]|uniref:Increased loss of mitochondrial DNA protein 1 n=1 Tax=Saccharata proteae CBS 121410 TaxID=1314787 RepID=A0A9P4HM92_9PEZI|nr:hypothetical protein K490DRAFT_49756 [Saccharata proteae CBS 121410]
MAIFSAFNIIRGLALFHLTLAYVFLTNPATVADQNVVFLFGEAMKLAISTFVKPNSATAFIAVLMAFLGLTDLTSACMDEEVAYPYWRNQTPIRLLFLFSLTAYTYAFAPSGTFRGSVGDTLKNRVVFTFGFFEVVMWFWVFITLRDERRQAAERLLERRRAEAEHL